MNYVRSRCAAEWVCSVRRMTLLLYPRVLSANFPEIFAKWMI